MQQEYVKRRLDQFFDLIDREMNQCAVDIAGEAEFTRYMVGLLPYTINYLEDLFIESISSQTGRIVDGAVELQKMKAAIRKSQKLRAN